MIEDTYILLDDDDDDENNKNNDVDTATKDDDGMEKDDDDDDDDRGGNKKEEEEVEEEEEEGDESYWVNFDLKLDSMPETDDNDGKDILSTSTSEGSDDKETNNNNTNKNKAKSGKNKDYNEEEEEEYNMLQRNLRQLYQSAHEHHRSSSFSSQINIILRTLPQSATIESMFPIFGLSRSLVEDHPNLRHTYRNLYKRLQQQNKESMLANNGKRLNPIEVGKYIMESLEEILERSANLSNDGKASITIVAQVSIHCKEIFCVKDMVSGEVLQGYEDGEPRDVTHLVRFEMVVKETMVSSEDDDESNDGKWELEIGRWQISDWDDLLDGNVFFTWKRETCTR